MDAEAAWKLAQKVGQVRVAKGKNNVLDFKADAKSREEALAAMMGPTGNLRAPALVAAGTLWVGYNEPLFAALHGALK